MEVFIYAMPPVIRYVTFEGFLPEEIIKCSRPVIPNRSLGLTRRVQSGSILGITKTSPSSHTESGTYPKFSHIFPTRSLTNPESDRFSSVALTGPAVFKFTAPSSPSRHREALSIFRGLSSPSDPAVARIPDDDLGDHLYDAIAKFLDDLHVPRGLKAVGYTEKDVDRIVEGTLPQRRVLDLAPGIGA